MSELSFHPDLKSEIQAFQMPEPLVFGTTMVPVMYRAVHDGTSWGKREVLPYGPLQVEPAAKVINYAQSVFEGMKAYKVAQNIPQFFRPDLNWQRLVDSGARLCMPAVPEDIFMEGISTVAGLCADFVPGGTGNSLYMRPILMSDEVGLGISVPETHTFLVIASPSPAYVQGMIKVLIEREDARAAIGGTGNVKVAGNYAPSLVSLKRAKEMGYDSSLWLDPGNRSDIEELSSMNFFAVIEGVIHAPKLTGSLLPGITRRSVIELAKARGHEVIERAMPIDDLIEDIKSGRCSEAFACGTAAIVAPIKALGEADGTIHEIADEPGSIGEELRCELLDIQEGRAKDPFDWMVDVPELKI